MTCGIIHNRRRDWHDGNHPGYALGTWLRDYKEQVFLFTRAFAVDWTNNVSERGANAAKRHQAVLLTQHEQLDVLGQIRPDQHRQQNEQAPQQTVDKR